MSMTRDEAIKHFSYEKYAGSTIAQALASAPAAVRNGLHAKDHAWIASHPEIDAYEALQCLHARGLANPPGKFAVVPRTAGA